MAAGPFEKSNLGWQMQQFWQRTGEWLETQFRFQPPDVPDAPRWSYPEWWLEIAFWFVVAAIALWLLWLLYQWLSPYVERGLQGSKLMQREPRDRKVERTVAGWMKLVQDFQRQGNYREACRSLYMAMLQGLNDAKLVPHQASRTDGEYQNLVSLLPRSQSYETILRTHEQMCFGEGNISAETFNRCQQAYREIEHPDSGT
jgi:Domain of unknown function (DUF4129)